MNVGRKRNETCWAGRRRDFPFFLFFNLDLPKPPKNIFTDQGRRELAPHGDCEQERDDPLRILGEIFDLKRVWRLHSRKTKLDHRFVLIITIFFF